MTDRGRLALLLGVVLYVAAWLVGSLALYPVAVGLVVAPLAAGVWVRRAARPERVGRRTTREEHLEGDDVSVELSADLRRGLRPAGLVLSEHVGRLGEQRTPLELDGRRAWGGYSLRRVPRGRYRFERSVLVLEDPFALARAEVEVPTGGALLVYPRLVELHGLFSESGRDGHQGRRLLLRRPAGFELHGVRDYQDGESLRRVHWPSTAKRGRLMVKDLEDSPRDELAVVLDAQSAGAVGAAFDVQVRAAGSILRAYGRRGRRALLAVNGATVETYRVTSIDGDWQAAYDALAAAEPNGAMPLAALFGTEGGPAARAVELVVVTSALPPSLVDALTRRSSGGRRTTLVYVDARTFAAGGEGASGAELLRLSAAGVAVTRVRHGDDLANVLRAAEELTAARA